MARGGIGVKSPAYGRPRGGGGRHGYRSHRDAKVQAKVAL